MRFQIPPALSLLRLTPHHCCCWLLAGRWRIVVHPVPLHHSSSCTNQPTEREMRSPGRLEFNAFVDSKPSLLGADGGISSGCSLCSTTLRATCGRRSTLESHQTASWGELGTRDKRSNFRLALTDERICCQEAMGGEVSQSILVCSYLEAFPSSSDSLRYIITLEAWRDEAHCGTSSRGLARRRRQIQMNPMTSNSGSKCTLQQRRRQNEEVYRVAAVAPLVLIAWIPPRRVTPSRSRRWIWRKRERGAPMQLSSLQTIAAA